MTGRNRASLRLARPHLEGSSPPCARLPDWMKLRALIAVIACGALAAGCGGGGVPSSSTTPKVAVTTTSSTISAALTTPSATTTTTQTAHAPRHRHHTHRPRPPATNTGPSGPTGPTGFTALPSSGTPTPSPPDRALQIAACRRMVANDTSTALTAAEARVLDQLCGLYGSKNPAKVEAAKLQICLLVVKDSGLPSAAATAERESCRLNQSG